MKLLSESIKKIGRETFAIDFAKAEQLGIELYQDKNIPLNSSSITLSKDGILYLNVKHKDYRKLKKVYMLLSNVSTDDLIKIYKIYDSKYPDVHKLGDIEKYKGKVRGDAIIKIILKLELLRRECKSVMIQPLLNLLLHSSISDYESIL